MNFLDELGSLISVLKSKVTSGELTLDVFKKQVNVRKAAKKSMAMFPLIASNGNSPTAIETIMKSLEREYSVYVRMVISLDDIISLDKNETKLDLLERLGMTTGAYVAGAGGNKNMFNPVFGEANDFFKNNFGVDWKYILDNLVKTEDSYYIDIPLSQVSAEFLLEKASSAERFVVVLDEIEKILQKPSNNPKDPNWIDDKDVKILTNKFKELEASYTTLKDVSPQDRKELVSQFLDKFSVDSENHNKWLVAVELSKQQNPKFDSKKLYENMKEDIEKYIKSSRESIQDAKTSLEVKALEQRINQIKEMEKRELERFELDKQRFGLDRAKQDKVTSTFNENSYKKAMNMPPTTLDIKIVYRAADTLHDSQNFVIGIKVYPRIVTSKEIVENIASSIKNSNLFFKLLRVLSGEKQFWKDLVFRIEESKKEVMNDKISKIPGLWFSLKTLKQRSNIRQLLSKSPILPTTTLLINEAEYNDLKDVYSIDLFDVNTINRLVDSLNLFGFIILSETTETIHVWDDEEKLFSSYSLDYLSDENSKSQNSVKSVIDYMNRRG
jgi:hypothetical protein